MKKWKKKILVLSVFLLFGLTGCVSDPPSYAFEYTGAYVDLNCVAINSILGAHSGYSNKICVLEEDTFGRRMGVCRGYTLALNIEADDYSSIIGILVVQKIDDEYVYYYPDYNFILYPDDPERKYIPSEAELLEYVQKTIKADDIAQLKAKNDWGKPFDESKCVRIKISGRDRNSEAKYHLVPREAEDNAIAQITLQSGDDVGRISYLTSDEYDRHIYFFRCRDENKFCTKSYVVMFYADGSFNPPNGIMEIKDVWNYQDDLKAFKERNGWNTPLP